MGIELANDIRGRWRIASGYECYTPVPTKSISTWFKGQSINKDGRLIRPDYVFRKTAPGGALKHNQSYQDASPSINFFLMPRSCCHFFVASCLRFSLALRLVSDGGCPTMLCYTGALLVTLKSNLPLESAVQFDRD